jgi:carboxymethylenebutenolidase
LFLLHVVLVGLVASFEADLDTIGSNLLALNVIAFSSEVGAGPPQKSASTASKLEQFPDPPERSQSQSMAGAGASNSPPGRATAATRSLRTSAASGPKLEMSCADAVVCGWFRDHASAGERISMTESNRAATDLGAVFDAHVKAEFVDRDVAAAMATMAPEPYLTHVPTLTGGTGRAQVERFYRDHFVGHWPDDVQVKTLSRTVGQNRVVDELVVSFTHDREMRVFLPGVAPTGRKVVLPHVVVMGFDEAGRVAYEHIYWDQATLLVQVGLLDPALLPVAGAEQAKRLLDPTQPANEMIDRSRLHPK